MEEVICKNCGSVDDYRTEMSNIHLKATCNSCDKFITFLTQQEKEFLMPMGKYKDRTLDSLTSPEELRYLEWLLENAKIGNNLKNRIAKHLKK